MRKWQPRRSTPHSVSLPLGYLELAVIPGLIDAKGPRQFHARLYARYAGESAALAIDDRRFDSLARAKRRAVEWARTFFFASLEGLGDISRLAKDELIDRAARTALRFMSRTGRRRPFMALEVAGSILELKRGRRR